jgi:hypothetical protein
MRQARSQAEDKDSDLIIKHLTIKDLAMRISVFNSLALGLVMMLAAGTASASTLATTTQALGSWQGSVNYAASSGFPLNNNLNATVEYAVFGSGKFQDFLDENSIAHVEPAAGEYVYAYQIVNVAPATNGINIFTVGLNGDEALGATGVTYVPSAINPAGVGGGPGVSTSSQWMFFGSLGPGQSSGILYYSSPNGPELGFSTMSAGVASQSLALSLPNPVPEPMSCVLLAGAVVMVLAGGRTRLAV